MTMAELRPRAVPMIGTHRAGTVFFEALGVDARVDGKPVKRSAEIARASEIARAPSALVPQVGGIEAIADATAGGF